MVRERTSLDKILTKIIWKKHLLLLQNGTLLLCCSEYRSYLKKKTKVKVLILYSVDVLLSFKNETCLTKKLSMNFHPHVLMD